MRIWGVAYLVLAGMAQADCPPARNLIDALPPVERAALQAATDAAPFASGNVWHATKSTQHITLVGTYHLDDPRHDAVMTALAPDLAAAQTLLVEAGPEEEAAMKAALAADPSRLISPGPTLPEALAPADWSRLSDALTARGIPPFFAARLQPWYVSTMLAVPACQFAGMATTQGLDKRLMGAAAAQGMAIKGLEPHDTIFSMFNSFSHADQIDMLLDTLAISGPLENDMARTLADSYFAGESRLFWEFSRDQTLRLPGADPARVMRQFALVEQALMTARNQAWIPVIEAEAAKGRVLVAFGALHLPGEEGVLNLLQEAGYVITP